MSFIPFHHSYQFMIGDTNYELKNNPMIGYITTPSHQRTLSLLLPKHPKVPKEGRGKEDCTDKDDVRVV